VIVSAGWLEMANDAFYLIGSAVFQCMEYHWTTKVRQKTFYFSFFKVLAGLTRLTWKLRPATYCLMWQFIEMQWIINRWTT
jgi:hypothetical protein